MGQSIYPDKAAPCLHFNKQRAVVDREILLSGNLEKLNHHVTTTNLSELQDLVRRDKIIRDDNSRVYTNSIFTVKIMLNVKNNSTTKIETEVLGNVFSCEPFSPVQLSSKICGTRVF